MVWSAAPASRIARPKLQVLLAAAELGDQVLDGGAQLGDRRQRSIVDAERRGSENVDVASTAWASLRAGFSVPSSAVDAAPATPAAPGPVRLLLARA